MRALFTFVGGRGHFDPLVPVARAVRDAGHAVLFACGPSMTDAVRAAGFDAHSFGSARAGLPERLPLRPVDREREQRELRDRFLLRAARERVPVLMDLCREWRADVIVCDEVDFGAMIASERLGIPHASVVVIAAGGFLHRDVIGDALDTVRAEHDLPADPEMAMLSRHLVLAPVPPSYRDPADPLPATAHAFAPSPPEEAGPAPAWSQVRPGAPRVYVTLGTIFNLESGDLFARLVSALGDLEVNLVATTGRDFDPADLGPQPDHVHVTRFIPQSEVLPHCDLVVSHAGSGSVLGTLAHGVPSVLLPLGADQPWNADRCHTLGIAEVLDAERVDAEGIRASVTRAIATPSYRERALALRAEFAALPSAASTAPLLEGLVR